MPMGNYMELNVVDFATIYILTIVITLQED